MVLTQLLENWNDAGDHQMVISLRQRGQLSARIESLNIPMVHLDLQPGKIDFSKFLKLLRLIRSYQPEIVHTWLYHADLIGGIAAKIASSASVIWGIHHTITDGHSVKSSTWNVVRILIQLSKNLPSQIICCSESAYQSHIAIGYSPNKMIIIENGVDADRFRPDASARLRLQNELNIPSQTKLIGMFARYHPHKDHASLLDAAGILLKTNPNVHFVLAGQGMDAANTELQDRIVRNNLSDHFHLLGERQDMPYLTAAMDIVTLSSHSEALPMTLCEGMSCAKPCVATNVGDIARLIGDSGIVVEPRKPQALADAWHKILELPDIEYNRLGYEARQRILQFYNLNTMLSEYRQTYLKSIRM